MNVKKTDFTNYIRFWSLLSLAGISLILILIETIVSYNEFKTRASLIRKTHISAQRNLIKKEVDHVVNIINKSRKKNYLFIKKTVKEKVNNAHKIAQSIFIKNRSKIQFDDLKKIIFDALCSFKYEENSGYFFIYDKDGLSILNPDQAETKGTNALSENPKKHDQSKIIKRFIKICKSSNQGYHEYINSGPDIQNKLSLNISYIKYFKPFEWIIGTGLYQDKIDEKNDKEIYDYVTAHRFGKNNNGYVFIYRLLNSNGGENFATMFANSNRPDLVGKAISDNLKDAHNKEFRKEFITKLKTSKNCFVDYWYKKFDNSEASPKTSYFKLTENKKFIVAAGVYLDDVEVEIQNLFSKKEEQLVKKIIYIVFITALILLFYFIIYSRISRWILKDFSIFISFLEKAYYSNEKIDRTKIKFNEIDKIAFYANQMVDNKVKADTEILEKKEKLKKAQQYIVNVINSMQSAIICVDSNECITHLNYSAEKIAKKMIFETLGQNFFDIFPNILSDKYLIYKSTKEHKKFEETNKSRLTKNGKIYENITVYPLISQDSIGAVIRIDNVTKEVLLEEQLNHTRKMDAIGQLTGGIAHDFNNMLNGILGAAELLSLSETIDKKNIKYLDVITQASKRAADLTAKLVSFGQKGKTPPKPVHIHELIDDSLTLLKGSVDKKIKFQFIKHAKNDVIKVVPTKFQNIIINLCINASQAMPIGGMISIISENLFLDTLACSKFTFNLKKGEFLKISVQDTGTGIPEENLRKIFEPYFTTREKGKGSGLGLAAVYGIVKSSQGAIKVLSHIGEGSTFEILFPLSYEKVEHQILQEQVLVKGTGTVLVVDDEEVARIMAKALLEKLNYKVILAKNGVEALNIYKKSKKKIDIVLLDMIMPKMDGKETFWALKKIKTDCKIILASGYSKKEDVQVLFKAGLNGYLKKPYCISTLSKIISQHLKKPLTLK